LPDTIDHAADDWTVLQTRRRLLARPGQQELQIAVTDFCAAQRREGVRRDEPLQPAFQHLALVNQAELTRRTPQGKMPSLRVAKVPGLQDGPQQPLLWRLLRLRFAAFTAGRPVVAVGAVLGVELHGESSHARSRRGMEARLQLRHREDALAGTSDG